LEIEIDIGGRKRKGDIEGGDREEVREIGRG